MARESVKYSIELDSAAAAAQMRKLRAASDEAATAGGKLQANTKKFRDVAGPTATATSGLASAMGGLGGRTAETVGFVDNLANAFSAGGALSLGLVGILGGVGLLAKEWFKVAEEAKKAEKAQQEAILGPAAALRLENVGLAASLAAAATGSTEPEVRVKIMEENLRAAEGAVEDLARGFVIYHRNLSAAEGRTITQADALERFRAESKEANDKVATLSQQLANYAPQARLYGALTRTMAEVAAAQAAADRSSTEAIKAKTEATKRLVDVDVDLQSMLGQGTIRTMMLRFRREALAEGKRRADAADAANRDMWDRRLARTESALDAITKMEEEAERRSDQLREDRLQKEIAANRAVADSFANFYSDVMLVAVSNFSSSTVGLVNGLADGQEKAFERAAVSFLRSTGTQLMGLGVQYGFQGAGMALTGNVPGGLALAGLGVGAFTAGAAMGGTGAALGNSLGIGSNGQGGDIGTRTPRSGGGLGSSAASSGNQGSGPVTINVNYGVGGFRPEDVAIGVREAVAVGKRRGIDVLGSL